MKIEEIIKSENITLSKKVILNLLYSQSKLNETLYVGLKPFDMSTEQFNVLRILRGQKGLPINMCDIQDRMIAKTSNTTRLVDKLLKKDLVTRNICKNNRRKMEVLITQKGLELLSILDPLVLAYEEHFTNNLNEEELNTLNTLLEKFIS
ncbi:MarR family transcriptional regulator [Neptunitalea chrysea]|uniref:MarR family transcriptional regulator n=1 Tax=Neptunitalea chrysea TaxID=1647581 RepID=A0A9W6B3V9_9FLAO|nr:MarR family transcriptional regulator [Neptunitalea chrysea]GLB52128.1 MarR family transcriptional regulator [Neptunitalea chrysea]